VKAVEINEIEKSGPFRLATHDPDEFAERISGIAPGLNCHALRSSGADIKIYAARLPSAGIFRSTMKNFQVQSSNPSFYGVTIPLNGNSRFLVEGHFEAIHGSKVHLQHPGKEFTGEMGEDSPFESIELCFDQSALDSIASKFYGQELGKATLRETLDLGQPAAQSFARHVLFTWSEIVRGGAILTCPLIAWESTQMLGALLVSAAGSDKHGDDPAYSNHSPVVVQRAEDYIMGNLLNPMSIPEVAAASGMSARTLSREFRRRHDTTIKGFIKQRRLEAANRVFMAAEPGETNVTRVALDFGFDQLGRFSADYQ
jgi:AraC-like DNA-binding protein